MCSSSFAKCLGITLIPLATLCVLCNILLFFPGGMVADDSSHITNEAFYFGGLIGSGILMIFPALVFLGLKNNDCCGCCGNESCGKRFAMFTSIIFAAVGVLGAGYGVIVASVAINHGPKCSTQDGNWTYPFSEGDYLTNRTLWDLCEGPQHIVSWHLTLFSLLLVLGLLQATLCAVQVINGLIGSICCSCSGNGAV